MTFFLRDRTFRPGTEVNATERHGLTVHHYRSLSESEQHIATTLRVTGTKTLSRCE